MWWGEKKKRFFYVTVFGALFFLQNIKGVITYNLLKCALENKTLQIVKCLSMNFENKSRMMKKYRIDIKSVNKTRNEKSSVQNGSYNTFHHVQSTLTKLHSLLNRQYMRRYLQNECTK